MGKKKTIAITIDFEIAMNPIIIEMTQNKELSAFINKCLEIMILQKVGNIDIHKMEQEVNTIKKKIAKLKARKVSLQTTINNKIEEEAKKQKEEDTAIYDSFKDNFRDLQKK